MLITHGAHVDAETSNGMMAVHKAIMSDTPAEVRNRSLRIVLRNGADPEALVGGGNLKGATPMLLCAAKGRPQAVRVLARYGAEVSIELSAWEVPQGKIIATNARQAGNEKPAQVMEELMEK